MHDFNNKTKEFINNENNMEGGVVDNEKLMGTEEEEESKGTKC